MKRFKYRAKKSPKEDVSGIIEAASQEDALEKIIQTGLVPVDIEEEKVVTAKKTDKTAISSVRVKTRDLTVAYQQLSRLVKSGIPLLGSLGLTAEQSESQALKGVLEIIQKGVREGYPLSFSMAAFPKIFSPFELAMVQTGENVGRLDEVLSRIAQYRKQQETLTRKVQTAIAYPIFVLCMAIGTVIFLLSFVIPRFSAFFLDLGQTLPLATRILIKVSEWSQVLWIWVVLAMLGAFWGLKKSLKSKTKKIAWDRMWLKIPRFGKIILMEEIARFSRSLEIMIHSGVPLVKAVRISVPVLSNEAIKTELERCCESLQEGGRFSDALNRSGVFPNFVAHLIRIGEEAGKLDETLGDLASWYEEEISDAISMLMQLLGPIALLVVGALLGMIVYAVLLPIFNMNAMVT